MITSIDDILHPAHAADQRRAELDAQIERVKQMIAKIDEFKDAQAAREKAKDAKP